MTSAARSLRRLLGVSMLLGLRLLGSLGLVGIVGIAGIAVAAPVRIAVAPFAAAESGDGISGSSGPAVQAEPSLGRRVADAIALELAGRPLDRLIAPDAFLAAALFDPSPEQVRRWAYNAAVETVVVGRVGPTVVRADTDGGEQRVEVVLRSGHSGAEIARHTAIAAEPALLEQVAATLAAEILATLGFDPTLEQSDHAVHLVGFAAPQPIAGSTSSSPRESGAEADGRGLEAALDPGGFDSEAPIEIKAEEAEIINRESGRNLVFKRNVSVRQANVTLRSDHLEATYRRGESEPERLVARGKVFVDQGDRRAKCDRAVYQRSSQQLICTGHAELVQGCDIVRGQSIEFFLGEDRARVEGAASIVIRPEPESDSRTEAEAACNAMRGVM